MTKQESIALRIRKTFPNKEIIEAFYVKKFDYMIDFYLPERKLAIEVYELGHFDRGKITENIQQKELEEYHQCTFIRIHRNGKDYGAYGGLGKIQAFIDTLKDEELKKLKYEIKELKQKKRIINRQDFKNNFRIKI